MKIEIAIAAITSVQTMFLAYLAYRAKMLDRTSGRRTGGSHDRPEDKPERSSGASAKRRRPIE